VKAAAARLTSMRNLALLLALVAAGVMLAVGFMVYSGAQSGLMLMVWVLLVAGLVVTVVVRERLRRRTLARSPHRPLP
jgi:Na+/melibiose symporter-like transporter